MSALYGVYGASGCGRGIMPLVRLQFDQRPEAEFVFVDDDPKERRLNGHDVLAFEEFLGRSADVRHVAIAIADPAVRRSVAARCGEAGLSFFGVRAGISIQMDDVVVGVGALISPFVTFTSNVRIGCHFHANLYSYVEHDCVIGDFVTFAPAVRCNGNVHIGDGVYIGAGAVIKQGRPGRPLVIGPNAIVGMGAVVTRDVPAGATVMGIPARVRAS